jgi:hypothetical protein
MRGSDQADVWSLRQVAGFVWRATWLWALVFSGAFLARTMAIWHDPDALQAIAGSGGTEDVFVLPFMMIVPAAIVGAAGALAGGLVARVYAPSRANTKSA